MATYIFPQFNTEIIDPIVTLMVVNDDIIQQTCSAVIQLSTETSKFGILFEGYSYTSDWNNQDIIKWINDEILPQYQIN